MAILGLVLLVCANLLSLLLAFMAIRGTGSTKLIRNLRLLLVGVVGSSLCVLGALVYIGDPHTVYAATNAAPVGSPIGYRIAAVWEGQSGGLLLWCFEMALVSLALKLPKQQEAIGIVAGIQFSLLMLTLSGNPFAEGTMPSTGMNPLLMHPMMLVHPPMLFLGYALISMPFAVTIGGLMRKNMAEWLVELRVWSILACLALTLGNGFGATWAYKTFGWGGFWNWDPVENTSFVPWLLGIVTLHGIRLARRSSLWMKITAVSALGGFLSVLYGSFLARSGVLAGASVHAYVQGEQLMKWALIVLLLGGMLISAAVLIRRWGFLVSDRNESAVECKSVGVGNFTLILIGVSVLVGMSLPAVGIIPETALYNVVLIPFALFAMLMLVLWLMKSTGTLISMGVPSFAIACIIAGFCACHEVMRNSHPAVVLTAVFSAFLVVVSVCIVMLSAVRAIGRDGRSGAHLTHAGIALLLIGSLFSGYTAVEESAAIKVGASVRLLAHTIKMLRVDTSQPNVFESVLMIDGRKCTVSTEENPKFNMLLRRALIQRGFVKDLYVTPLEISVEQGGSAMLRICIKPFMSLVWIGMFLVGLGLAVSLLALHNEQ